MATLQPILPANEARANFYQMLDEAGEQWRQFTITLRGKPHVVVMSAEEFEGWQETFDIMSDKKLVASIKRGEKELKEKKGIPWEKAKKILKW